MIPEKGWKNTGFCPEKSGIFFPKKTEYFKFQGLAFHVLNFVRFGRYTFCDHIIISRSHILWFESIIDAGQANIKRIVELPSL